MGKVANAIKATVKKRIKEFVPTLLRKPAVRKMLKSGAKFIKGKIESTLDAYCPSCKEVAKVAVDQPIVKEALKKGKTYVEAKCKTCGEVLDVVLNA